MHSTMMCVLLGSPTLSSALWTLCMQADNEIGWNHCTFYEIVYFRHLGSFHLSCTVSSTRPSRSLSFRSFLTLYSIVSTVCSSYHHRRCRRPYMKCIQFGNLNSNKTLLVYKIILRAIVQYPVMPERENLFDVCVCSSVFCSIPAIRIHCKQRTCHNTTNRMYGTLIASINILSLSFWWHNNHDLPFELSKTIPFMLNSTSNFGAQYRASVPPRERNKKSKAKQNNNDHWLHTKQSSTHRFFVGGKNLYGIHRTKKKL